jgi:hypothetical protein
MNRALATAVMPVLNVYTKLNSQRIRVLRTLLARSRICILSLSAPYLECPIFLVTLYYFIHGRLLYYLVACLLICLGNLLNLTCTRSYL